MARFPRILRRGSTPAGDRTKEIMRTINVKQNTQYRIVAINRKTGERTDEGVFSGDDAALHKARWSREYGDEFEFLVEPVK